MACFPSQKVVSNRKEIYLNSVDRKFLSRDKTFHITLAVSTAPRGVRENWGQKLSREARKIAIMLSRALQIRKCTQRAVCLRVMHASLGAACICTSTNFYDGHVPRGKQFPYF